MSVDVLRGLVLAVMLLTPPVRVGDSYPHLAHADWAGLTISDLVLPLLLVTSGASLRFLLRKGLTREAARRLVRRAVALVAIGLLYNVLAHGLDLTDLRVTGVLQLIGVAGVVAALLAAPWLRASWRVHAAGVAATFVVGLVAWTLTMLRHDAWRASEGVGPFNGLDESVFGVTHLYRGGEGIDYDPEGIAVMLAAGLLVLAGYLAAHVLFGRGRDAMALASVALGGVALVILGLALGDGLPVVKRVMSPTYVMVTAGIGLLLLAAISAVLDHDWRRRPARVVAAVVAWPFATIGWNALVLYLGEHVLLEIAFSTPSGDTSLVFTWLGQFVSEYGDRGAMLPGLWLLAVLFAVTAAMRALKWRVTL